MSDNNESTVTRPPPTPFFYLYSFFHFIFPHPYSAFVCFTWNNINNNIIILKMMWQQISQSGFRLGPRGRSLPGCFSSAKKGALVSWERELLPSPDAEALPGDSVMSSD